MEATFVLARLLVDPSRWSPQAHKPAELSSLDDCLSSAILGPKPEYLVSGRKHLFFRMTFRIRLFAWICWSEIRNHFAVFARIIPCKLQVSSEMEGTVRMIPENSRFLRAANHRKSAPPKANRQFSARH